MVSYLFPFINCTFGYAAACITNEVWFIHQIIYFQASKKKVYMLYNLEPDRSISGGAWYQDQDFESEFVDILNVQCYRFLSQRSEKMKNNPRGPIVGRTQTYATAAEVQKYITDLGISKVSQHNLWFLF